ncbi:MAG: EAL domain-containing protein [Pigmentiphaga sp.]
MALDLVTASALILALGYLQGFNTRLRRQRPLLAEWGTGVVAGAMCIIGMLMPIELAGGVIFDARTVVLSLAGFFGGVWVGLIAGVMAAAYRLFLGGAGANVGVLVIIAAVLMGLGYRSLSRGRGWPITPLHLLGFGVLVQLVSIALFTLLPEAIQQQIFPQVAVLYVLVLSPATVLLGLILCGHEDREHTTAALAASEAQLRAITAASPDTSLVIDEDGFIHEAVTPSPDPWPGGIESLRSRRLHRAFPDEVAAAFETGIAQALGSGEPSLFEYALDTSDGRRTFEARARVIDAPLQGRRAVLVVARDITRRLHIAEELRVAAKAFETQHGLLVTDVHKRILRVNQAFTRVTGYPAEEVIGQPTSILSSGRHEGNFFRQMWEQLDLHGSWEGEILNRHRDGNLYPARLTISVVTNESGAVTHYVGSLQDLTQTKQAEAEIHSLALFDQLTSLPNRRQFTERLHMTLSRHHEDPLHGALLFIDIDDFKNVNDLFNHQTGDLLLQQVAQRLRNLLEPEHLAARFGADEFVVLLENLPADPTGAQALAERTGHALLECFRRPFFLEQQYRQVSASIGITVFGGGKQLIDELLLHADLAMHQAKRCGKGRLHFFDPAMQQQVTTRLQLEDDIRQGIRRQEFTLYYQPQVDGQGRVSGAEALVRWPREHGVVPPGEFIPVAEAAGLMPALGKQILRQVCQQLAAWRHDPILGALRISVNLSVSQLFEADFVESLLGILVDTNTPADHLVLEITESLLLNDLDDAQAILRRLRGHGVRFSIDDFGTGYSSLAYLQRLPLNELKIDQSFVNELPANTNNLAIVRMILGLANALNLEVVAEGVETADQWRILRHEGCPHFQGYHFARPMPPDDFQAWVHSPQPFQNRPGLPR